ncbi:MAG: hypothetical protein QOE66_2759, partial [Chloroflexota bacterium]|nr:hypothetical protein [Chloroflexota bacterium]
MSKRVSSMEAATVDPELLRMDGQGGPTPQRSRSSKVGRRFSKLLLAVVVATLITSTVLVVPALAASSPTGAAISSDQADYAPGATVTLTGTGWASGESVSILVNDTMGQTWSHSATVTATAGGGISDSFALPNYFVSSYDVIATGSVSGTATTTFTDVSIGTYDQCSNDTGTGYTTGDLGCRWINGDLNKNNSLYQEGDATVQRAWLTGFLPGSTHTVTFRYGTTKAGKHAYDFLTTYNYSESWVTTADLCQTITGCLTASSAPPLLIPQPDPLAGGFDTAAAPQYFNMVGGTFGSATTPALVSGSYAGDSDTAITITFTVDSSGSMCPTSGS